VLDEYLPHPDLVIRHQATVSATREDVWDRLWGLDWARVCQATGVAIEDMRAVPPFILELAHRVQRLDPGTTFPTRSALRVGFALLAEKPPRHLVFGAVGKLWKRHPELLGVDPENFASFKEPKYAKLIIGFLVLPQGEDRSLLKQECRLVATDDSARTHHARAWRPAEPYIDFFMQRALATLKGSARKDQMEAKAPPWRPRAGALR
jgi:hypothetical protein